MSLFTRLLTAAAFATCTSASATIISFDDYPGSANNGTVLGTITSDGYNFTSSHGHLINNPSSCAGGCASNGTQYLGGDMTNLLIDMGGTGFSIRGFDFAEAFATRSIPTELTVEAFFLGGGSSTQTYSFDGVYDGIGALVDFQSLGVNLSNLSSLRLSANGFFAVDNIDDEASTQVPEPTILSLQALGLGGLGLSRRRK